MTVIDQDLLQAIRQKTGLSKAQVYARIKQVASDSFLPRNLAAIKLGAEIGLAINKYADESDLAHLRSAGAPVAPPANSAPAGRPPAVTSGKARQKAGKPKTVANQVFVVHGRDAVARKSMFDFLRAVGVKPIEWNAALALSKKASPYIGEILDAAFKSARAVVVLLTPDDLAKLREDLLSGSDKPYERTLTGQARPNVLFEAGMAFATHPDRTLLVQLGNLREFSDVAGRHVVHMSNSPEKRQELATKLRNAGCDTDLSGADWYSVGDFSDPLARAPSSGKVRRKKKQAPNTA